MNFVRTFGIGVGTTLSLVALASSSKGQEQPKKPEAEPKKPEPEIKDYKLMTDIPIGGGGSWDYLSCEPNLHRLFVTHQTKIVVIDTTTNKVVGDIIDTSGVHGFVPVADLRRGFSSNGLENTSSIVDLETLKTLSKVTTEKKPDSIIYEPVNKEVYTFNGSSSSATAFEAESGKVTATIKLDAAPETGVADKEDGKVFVNIESKNEIQVIDVKEHKVIATWPIAPGEGPTGLSFDPELHRLIVGCGGNGKMVLVDSNTGKVLDSIDSGKGIDAAAVDPYLHQAYTSNGGDGTVTIAKIEGDKLKVLQTLTTERGARTMTIDVKNHRIYLANAKSRTDASSFHVLVYGFE